MTEPQKLSGHVTWHVATDDDGDAVVTVHCGHCGVHGRTTSPADWHEAHRRHCPVLDDATELGALRARVWLLERDLHQLLAAVGPVLLGDANPPEWDSAVVVFRRVLTTNERTTT